MPTQLHTRVLHIDVAGRDRAGVTHSLTGILARAGVRILDVGQAVIHDALSLGILVELTDEMRSSSLLTDLLLTAHDLGMQIRFRAIGANEYEGWVRAQGKGRFVITVLGPALTAEHLQAVSGVVAGGGLNIDRIDRLSGRTPLDADGAGRVCV
jgi:phosphoserine phosphatase